MLAGPLHKRSSAVLAFSVRFSLRRPHKVLERCTMSVGSVAVLAPASKPPADACLHLSSDGGCRVVVEARDRGPASSELSFPPQIRGPFMFDRVVTLSSYEVCVPGYAILR